MEKQFTKEIFKEIKMQIDIKNYNPEIHEKYKALSVKQPYANDLITPAYSHNGNIYGVKSIEVRSRNTTYRGELLICSAASPIYPGTQAGAIVGKVELYGVKPLEEFTEEDWQNTCIPESQRQGLHGWGWLMCNPRRVIEMPCKGQLGIFNLCYTKGMINEYPTTVTLDKKAWNRIKRHYF